MRIISFASVICALWLISCSDKRPNLITFQVSKSDYVEKLEVSGTVQAVINLPIMPPRSMYGQMTIVRLAQNGEFVKKGDTICVLSLPELESRYKDMMTSIEKLEAEMKKIVAENKLNIALLEARLATNEAQLKISYLDSLQMTYTTELKRRLIELEMRKSMIEKQKTEKKLSATKAIGATEIRQRNARMMLWKAQAKTMVDQVNSLTIIAQRDGIVMRCESPQFMIMGPQGVGRMGGPISEGSVLLISTPVLQFPDLKKMQISAGVAEADFRKIEKGQKVNITVEASKMLMTTGSVNRKSLASSTANRYTPSKVKSYEIVIDIDSCHTKMKPGLSANCEIILREEKDTLFVPTLAIFERDSAKVVYVMGKKKFMPVSIETGSSGSSFTIIKGGLKGNEKIALTEPPFNLIAGKNGESDTLKIKIPN